MSIDRIKLIAADQFSRYGYTNASLSKIAEQVGIKKPSIYAHFKSKKDLFLNVLENASIIEMEFFLSYLKKTQDTDLEKQLEKLITCLINRYNEEVSFRFLLRSGFFPPQELYKEVMDRFYTYLDHCEGILMNTFNNAIKGDQIRGVDAEKAGIAFVGLLDSLYIEMLFGGLDRAKRRVDASLELFLRGLAIQV